MLKLYDFGAGPKSYAKATLQDDGELGRLLERVTATERDAWIDFDPMWREVLVFSAQPAPKAAEVLRDLLEACGSEAGLTHQGTFSQDLPKAAGQGRAKRVFVRGGKSQSADVLVELSPAPPGSGLSLETPGSDFDPVLAHGLRRSARSAPESCFPLSDALLRVSYSVSDGGGAALSDLHAAATLAASRCLQTVGTVPTTPRPESSAFPEMENSAADTVANFYELCAYPAELLDEEERGKLGAFLAYQVSLLFGHEVDPQMRRQPAVPSPALRAGLGEVARQVVERVRGDERMGAQMLLGLLELWLAPWTDLFPKPEPAAAAPADPAPGAEPEATPPSE